MRTLEKRTFICKKRTNMFMRTLSRTLQLLLAVMLSLGLLFSIVTTASAHAKVLSATPGIGATITQAPTKVTVETAENMKPGAQFSNLFVYAPNGDLISQGNATIPLNSPKEMSIAIKPSGNGVYVVRWNTVSADDGDPDQGAFIFTVQAQVPATPTPASHSTTTPPPASNTGNTPLWIPILVGILALLVGVGVVSVLGSVVQREHRPSELCAGLWLLRKRK